MGFDQKKHVDTYFAKLRNYGCKNNMTGTKNIDRFCWINGNAAGRSLLSWQSTF